VVAGNEESIKTVDRNFVTQNVVAFRNTLHDVSWMKKDILNISNILQV
jgi:hypothetical protein